MDIYTNAERGEMKEFLAKLDPVVKNLAAKPKSWWQTRKKYSRLNESLIRGYISSKIRDVRLGGRAEADKFIEKLVSGKKSDLPSDISAFISKNRGAWGDFIYKTVATLDPDALIGFFVPFIYGGIISRKNMTGEAFGIINFSKNESKTPPNERILRAVRAIEVFKRQGISLILIEGGADTICSRQMLSVYRSSPNEAFLIVERGGESEVNAFSSGKSAYDRAVLSELGASKNVFVLLEAADPTQMNSAAGTMGKSRALSSYGILHGARGNIDEKTSEIFGNGSGFIIFDREISLLDNFGGSLQMPKRVEEIVDLVPQSVIDFLCHPALPIRLPDLYELFILSQFILTAGKIREIRREIV